MNKKILAFALLGIASQSALAVTPPTISVVYKTQDAVPGGSTNDHFTYFGNPAFNDYNHVAFQATVSAINQFPILYSMAASPTPASNPTLKVSPLVPVMFTNTWTGIWAQDNAGKLQQIVRSAPFIPDIGGFTSFSDPVYNNSNAVAFIGNYRLGFIMIPTPLNTDPASVFRGGTGVWSSSTLTNPLHPVAFIGEPAPGYPKPLVTSVGTLTDIANQSSTNGVTLSNPPITFTNPVTFSSFDQIALPDQGGVVILATVSTTNSSSPSAGKLGMPMSVISQPLTQQGIWAQDTSGNLKLIARQGGTIKVGSTNKTIESLSFLNSASPIGGQTRHFSQDTGNLFFTATFTDGTQAGVKVIFP